jgi:phosphomannomutase/phosphoglucomutase
LKATGAVMITGSHNPPEYNGFKVVSGEGTVYGAEIQAIREIMERGDYASGAGSLKTADVVPAYVDEVASQFQLARRVKVVADAGNGTAGPVIHRIFEKLNVHATELFFEMDGHFPNHHPDPTVPKFIAELISALSMSRATCCGATS